MKPDGGMGVLREVAQFLLAIFGTPRQLCVWVAIASFIGIAGTARRMIETAESDALAAGRERVQSRVLAVSEHISGTVRQVDTELQGFVREWRSSRVEFDVHVARFHERLAGIGVRISVTDREGWVTYSNLPLPRVRINVSDREHIRAHLQGGDDRLLISRPVKERVSGKWTVQLTRAIRGPKGLEGVMVMSVDPEYFHRFSETLGLEDGDTIALVHPSGDVLMRYPAGDGYVGVNIAGAPYLAATAASSGIFTGADQTDRVERLHAYRRLADQAPVVVAAVPMQRVLAPYLARRSTTLAAALAVWLAIAAGLLVALRAVKVRKRLARGPVDAKHDIENSVRAGSDTKH
jgi:hypothetical protein